MSYPMLFQRVGGLQVQVRETLSAIEKKGIDASLFDWRTDRLEDCDIVHVFGAVNGNHRIVEAAKAAGCKVVLSTVMHPPFTARDRRLAEFGGGVLGRLTGWKVQSSYAQLKSALDGADRIVALGAVERDMLANGYGVFGDRIVAVPNGISQRFFDADARLFTDLHDLPRPWVACVASVSPYKNQKTLVEAMAGTDVHVVIAGPVLSEFNAYLESCIAEPHVTYVGLINYSDDLLPALYAAADAYVLPSLSEVMPLGVLEALAADTPAVVTLNQSLDLAEKPGVLRFVDPQDRAGILRSVQQMLDDTARQDGVCADYVRQYKWDSVADDIIGIYRELTS